MKLGMSKPIREGLKLVLPQHLYSDSLLPDPFLQVGKPALQLFIPLALMGWFYTNK